MGCELNIVDYKGGLDLEPRYQKGLDLGIASIHEPCYTCGTVSQNTAAYLGAMKIPLFTSSDIPMTAVFLWTTKP